MPMHLLHCMAGGFVVSSTVLPAACGCCCLPNAPFCCKLVDSLLLLLLRLQALNPFGANNTTFRYWEEPELVDLVNTVGLTDYRRTRSRMYIMFAATKPEAPQW